MRSHWQKKLSPAAFAALTFVLAAQLPLAAHGQQRGFQPGDTVTDGGYVYKVLRCKGKGEWDECETQAYLDAKPAGAGGPRWVTIHELRAIEQRHLATTGGQATGTDDDPADAPSANTSRRTATPPQPQDEQSGPSRPLAGAECNYDPPGPRVTARDGFSEVLAKRKIYDEYNWTANGTMQAPLKVGVVFLSFQTGTPYKNTVQNLPGYGAQRRHAGAPAGTTIYTLKTKVMVCEQYRDGVERRLVEGSRACFIDKDDAWTCPSENDTKITQLDQD